MPVTKERRPAKSEKVKEAVAIVVTEIQKPPTLGKKGEVVWDRIVPELERQGMVCSVDAFLLGQYCGVVAAVEELQVFLNKHGYTIQKSSAAGSKVPRAEAKLIEKLEARAIKLAAQLGISPAARKTLRIKLERKKAKVSNAGSISDLAGQ